MDHFQMSTIFVFSFPHPEIYLLVCVTTVCISLNSLNSLRPGFCTECSPRLVQLLYLQNALPVTNNQRLQILERCLVWFQKDVTSRQSGRMYDMLSYFIGPKYTTGISLVDGVQVEAFCIFNRDHEPVETEAYPADVYNGVSVDITAARRHGFSVVACLGVSDTRLLRHPIRTPNGYSTLEASALKSQGCYIIPVSSRASVSPLITMSVLILVQVGKTSLCVMILVVLSVLTTCCCPSLVVRHKNVL